MNFKIDGAEMRSGLFVQGVEGFAGVGEELA
jgi:hypothetical protein